ncbi:hypothetical protein BDV96DRAFT_584922 [Lophiotrema nucula]|uniref:Uncharacterized protein n=1 Tax=Lophiotrema nucula TaxID=690887 RepID=A0A6A5YTC4_9PLEO|nr:hypothetical protein BDV96DRAFT_584922 [Lophiotrema nucula]
MEGAELVNALNFRCALSPNSGPEYKNVSSAGRLEGLLQYTLRTKLHMLLLVSRAELVSAVILDQVTTRFPQIARWYRSVIRMFRTTDDQYFVESYEEEIYEGYSRYQTTAVLRDCVQLTLELASAQLRQPISGWRDKT